MTVLIVDDDRIARIIIEQRLKQLSIQEGFSSAENGQKAMEYMRESGVPDIIFLDINMPVMNGFDVLKAMEQEGMVSKVYIVTSSMLDTDKSEAEQFKNVKGFYQKPFDAEHIKEIFA